VAISCRDCCGFDAFSGYPISDPAFNSVTCDVGVFGLNLRKTVTRKSPLRMIETSSTPDQSADAEMLSKPRRNIHEKVGAGQFGA